MKKLFFSFMLVLALFSASAQSAGFKALLKDNPDPTKAILLISSNHYGALYLTSGNKVHGTPASNSKFDVNGEMPGIRAFYIEPGEYELTAFTAIIGLGSYPNFSTYSNTYPYKGIFKLEAGKAYHLGYMNVTIPTNRVRGSINLAEGERTCTYEANDERLTASRDYLEKFSKVFNSVHGVIEQVAFSQEHTICPAGNVIFNERFADNSRGWKTSDDGIYKSYIADNSLIVENNGEDSYMLTIPVKIPKSFDLQAEITWTGGDDNKGFGLILGNDDKNCFKFTISGNGYFSIQRLSQVWDRTWGKGVIAELTGNMAIPFVEDWSKLDCIQTGAGAKNVIRVQRMPIDSKTSNMFIVYVNDVLVARNIYFINPRNYNPIGKNGVIGVYSYEKQNTALNRLTLSEL